MINKIFASKRGSSAVELIVSFILFSGIVVFLLVYMSPLKSPVVLSNVESISDKVKELNTVNMEIKSVSLKNQSLAACFRIADPFRPSEDTEFVLDANEKSVRSNTTGNYLEIFGQDKFYYACNVNISYQSSGSSSCALLQAADYDIGVSRTEEIYSYDLLKAMNQSYFNDYAGLKSRMVSNYDFAVLVYKNQSLTYFNMRKTIPVTSIITQEYPIQMLKDNEKIAATMRVYAW